MSYVWFYLSRSQEASNTSKPKSSHVLDNQRSTEGNVSLPNATNPLPPIPNKGARPRINTMSKRSRKASIETPNDIPPDDDVTSSQNLIFTRSDSQVSVIKYSNE